MGVACTIITGISTLAQALKTLAPMAMDGWVTWALDGVTSQCMFVGAEVSHVQQYRVAGCGIVNLYRHWNHLSGFEETYPSGQGCRCDGGFGHGNIRCYARCCR